jgi:P63C domain
MVDDAEVAGRAKGGRARALTLTSEERSEIARKGAEVRWSGEIKHATHGSPDHPVRIGDIELPCYVLSDGTRVLSQSGLQTSVGMSLGGSKTAGAQRLAVFVESIEQKGVDIKDLSARIRSPIRFVPTKGGRSVYGFEATILTDLCDVILAARAKPGTLQAQQLHIAEQCEILVRGLARVGIIALVDEATGYQEVRDKQALQAILDAFLRKELATWAKRFPDEFYEHIFRLRGWPWKGRRSNPPQVVAHYTKDIVYARLAPHVLEELEKRNPTENGKRRAKHHQWLTDEIGIPALAQHLYAAITLMRVSRTWDQFMLLIDEAHPRRGDTLLLPFMSDFSSTELPLQPAQ